MASVLDDIASGIKRGVGGEIAQVGRAAQDIGIDTSAIQDYGNNLVAANPASVNTLSDIGNRPGTAITEAVAANAPAIATNLAAGKLGQLAGGALGAIAGEGNPGAIKTGSTIGGLAGSGIADFLQFYGGNRQEQDAAGVDNKGTAALGAAGQAAINQLPLMPIKRLLGIPGGSAAIDAGIKTIPQVASDIAKGAAKTGLIGGLSAAAQTAISKAQAEQELKGEDVGTAGAQGAIVGSILGGASHTVEHLVKPTKDDMIVGHAASPQTTIVEPTKGPLSRAVGRAADEGKVDGIVNADTVRASLPVTPEAPPQDVVQPEPQVAEQEVAPYSGQYGDRPISFPASKTLSAPERVVEQRAATQLLADPQKALDDYKALPGTDNGRIISTDEAREVFPDYNSGPEARSAFSFAVHEPSSWIAKEQYNQRMAQPPEEGKAPVVLFTAGGTGAGKTTAIDRAPGFKSMQNNADTVYDGNLNGFASARAKIDQALASGRKAAILYVNRDPMEAFTRGVLPRAAKESYGRTVSMEAHADTHIGAAQTLEQLADHYKHNPDVNIQVINNGKTEAKVGDITDVSHVAGMDRGTLLDQLKAGLEDERQNGNVPDRVYNFYPRSSSEGAVQSEGIQQRSGVEGSAQPDGQQAASAGVVQDAGGIRGSAGVLPEPARQAQRDGGRESDGSLRGLPRKVGGFEASAFQPAQRIAHDYVASTGRDYAPPHTFAKVVPERATKIAAAYDAMKHDPTNPEVQHAYSAMIDETAKQYQAMKKSGLSVEFIKPGMRDPYEGNPRKMIDDVRNNNHMWVFSTKDGFGSDAHFDVSQNPLLGDSGEKFGEQPALHNDIFRAVHDYFGHVKEGVGFRADGEENAWRAHSAMYSEQARRAMTSETRGQNSWVNYGPKGEANRTASAEATHYADQKIGLLPDWVVKEGAGDDARALAPTETKTGPGLGIDVAKNLADRQTKNWKNGPAVEVVKTNNDLPSDLRASLGYKNVEGAYDGNGKIFIVADHVNSARDVRRIIAHEAYAHYGVKGILGDRFGDFLSKIDTLKDTDADIRAAYDATQKRYGDLSPEARADEVVAHLAENYSTLKGRAKVLVAQIVSAFKDFLRKHLNINTEMSAHDVLAMIAKAKRSLEKGVDEKVQMQARASVADPLFNHPPGDANALRDGAEMPDGLKRGGKYKTREIAAALEARQRQIAGHIGEKDFSPESSERIAKWMQAEVEHELQNPEQSGAGWYSDKYQRALDNMGDSFPELKHDKTARNTLTALIAITSDGQKVYPNFKQAAHIYDNFRKTGKFESTIGHMRSASIDNNLGVIQRLHAKYGADGMHEYLMQEKTVKELKALAKANGDELTSEYSVKTKLPMAAIEFGPKLGAFYANLMGSHGYLTMDRWWSRTFNRYRGDLLERPTRQGLDRLKQLLGDPKMSDDEALSASVAPRNSYKDKGYPKDGSPLEKAANTIYKMAFENLKDTPNNATDRTFMIDTVNRVRDNMAKEGKHISAADIQATLWYYEKRLYGELGARPSSDTSYEDAAKRVVSDRTDQSVGPTALAADARAGSAYPTPSGAIREDATPRPDDGVRASVPEPKEGFDGWTRPSEKLDRYITQSAGQRLKAYLSVAGLKGDKLRTLLQDFFLPVKRTQEAIAARGGKIEDASDVYGREELYYGRTGQRLDALENEHVKPLVESIAKAGVSIDDAELYLYAKFASERNARIASINPEIQDGGSGMTNADAAKVLDDFKSQGLTEKLDKIADRVYALNEVRVKALEDSGLISKEEAAAWRSDKHYVPLKGFADGIHDDEGPTRPPVGAGFSVGGKEAWRALGRRSRATDIIANAVAQTDQAIIRSEKNRVAQALLKLAQDNPNKSLWDVNATHSKPSFDKATGEVKYTEVNEPDAVVAKVNGEEYRINLYDRQLLESIKNMGASKVGSVLRTLGAANRFLSMFRTMYSPEFVLSNFARDQQTSATNLTGLLSPQAAAKAVTVNMPHAIKAMWGQLGGKKVGGEWARWAQEFEDAGGMTHFVNQETVESKQAKIEQLLKTATGKRPVAKLWSETLDYVNKVNGTVENATRLSAYAEARRAGMSTDQAARLAKNITVNFNRKGSAGAAINAMFLFYNASIQGAQRFLSAMKNPKVQGVMASTAALGFGLGYYNRMAAGKDDDGQDLWDKEPDWEKSRNLVVMNAFGKGNNLKIPMPYTYNLPYLIGQNMADVMFGKKAPIKAGADLVNALINAFDPVGSVDVTQDPTQQIVKGLSPTVLQPFADLAFNKNYFGSPIMPEQDQNAKVPTPDSQSFFKGSTNAGLVYIAKELNRLTGGNPVRSGAIDVSPASMQYLFDYIGGGTGSFFERIVHDGISAFRGDPIPVNKIPFVRTFLSQPNENRVNDTYYTARDDINQKAEMAKVALKPGAFPDATAGEKQEMIFGRQLEGPLKTTEHMLTQLRRARTAAQSRSDDAAVKDLDEKMRKVMLNFNRAYFAQKERSSVQ